MTTTETTAVEPHVEFTLPDGTVVLVDRADVEAHGITADRLGLRREARRRRGKVTHYTAVVLRGVYPEGKHREETLARVILGLARGDGKIADHVGGDTLDNRRANLRVTDARGNARNQGARVDNASGRRGVSYHRHTGLWRAQVNHAKDRHHLGVYATPAEAAVAYTAAAKLLFGEHYRPELPHPDDALGDRARWEIEAAVRARLVTLGLVPPASSVEEREPGAWHAVYLGRESGPHATEQEANYAHDCLRGAVRLSEAEQEALAGPWDPRDPFGRDVRPPARLAPGDAIPASRRRDIREALALRYPGLTITCPVRGPGRSPEEVANLREIARQQAAEDVIRRAAWQESRRAERRASGRSLARRDNQCGGRGGGSRASREYRALLNAIGC